MRRSVALVTSLFGLLLSGCGSGGAGGDSSTPTTTITSMNVSCTPASIQTGQTSQCSATAHVNTNVDALCPRHVNFGLIVLHRRIATDVSIRFARLNQMGLGIPMRLRLCVAFDGAHGPFQIKPQLAANTSVVRFMRTIYSSRRVIISTSNSGVVSSTWRYFHRKPVITRVWFSLPLSDHEPWERVPILKPSVTASKKVT